MSENQKDTSFPDTPMRTLSDLPAWLYWFCGAAVLTCGSQISLFSGFPAGLGEVTMATAFAALLFCMWRYAVRISFPAVLLVFVLSYSWINVVSGSGRMGGLEVIQRVEQLFCGMLVFAYLLRADARLVSDCLGIGIVVNIAVFLFQSLSGNGGESFGLFHSRMALAFYFSVALLWVQPFWLDRLKGRMGAVGVVLGTAIVLACIPHGQVLLIAVFCLLLFGAMNSTRAFAVNSCAVLLLAAFFAVGGEDIGKGSEFRATLSPFAGGDVKQCHTELVAAFRMASENFACGVGSGSYQANIGSYYRELPNPNWNSIQPDTQAGYGILLSTVGFPVGVFFIATLIYALGHSFRCFGGGNGDSVFVASAGSLGVLLGGMAATDPFVQGVGWFIPLALGGAFGCALGASSGGTGLVKMSWKGVLGWGISYAVAALVLISTPAQPRFCLSNDVTREQPPTVRPDTPGQPDSAQTSDTGSARSPNVEQFTADMNYFELVDADEAIEIVPPFQKITDSTADRETVLHVPDEQGKPPEGVPPDMKYGGAVFEVEIPKPSKCRIWLRVWWEGACGNSLYLKTGPDEDPITIGNDGTYRAWHWLESQRLHEFSAGKHRLVLLNREDGIRVDQILLTGDLQYVPQGIEVE